MKSCRAYIHNPKKYNHIVTQGSITVSERGSSEATLTYCGRINNILNIFNNNRPNYSQRFQH